MKDPENPTKDDMLEMEIKVRGQLTMFTHNTHMPDLGLGWVRQGLNGTNMEIYMISFQCILAYCLVFGHFILFRTLFSKYAILNNKFKFSKGLKSLRNCFFLTDLSSQFLKIKNHKEEKKIQL